MFGWLLVGWGLDEMPRRIVGGFAQTDAASSKQRSLVLRRVFDGYQNLLMIFQMPMDALIDLAGPPFEDACDIQMAATMATDETVSPRRRIASVS